MQLHNKKDKARSRAAHISINTLRADQKIKNAYEQRYLQMLDSAVTEAEKLLNDVKHLLKP